MLRKPAFVHLVHAYEPSIALVQLHKAKFAVEKMYECITPHPLVLNSARWRDSVASARRFAEDWNAGDLPAGPRNPTDIAYCSVAATELLQWCSQMLLAKAMLDSALVCRKGASYLQKPLLLSRLLSWSTALVVGIDLGTTNSAVAAVIDGTAHLIPNRVGQPTTPSMVAILPEGVLVGQSAADQASSNVQNTLHSAKRFIGRSSAQVARDISSVGFTVGSEDEEVAFFCPARAEPLAPEEVSAAVLSQLIADAENHLQARVTSAVITVPAYFNERQRIATTSAARIAGIEEISLLSEPVAACLAYGMGGATGRVLVFDLGAGTFDVSVLELCASGDVEVLATSGDAHLGGEDFDAALVGWLARQAESQGIAVRKNKAAMRRLREAAEAAKIRLSVMKSVTVEVSGAEEGQEVEVELTRSQLEELCEPLLRRLKNPLYEVALTAGAVLALAMRVSLPGEQEEKGMQKKAKRKERRAMAAKRPVGSQKNLPLGTPVDEIVMVGGASKMTAVRKLVTNLFGVDPRRTVDPMQAVALGAALQAGILSGEVQGMRVLQTWQADLGRILDRMRGDEAGDVADNVDVSSWLDDLDEESSSWLDNLDEELDSEGAATL
ncbi:MAG: hypothetical protein SGPRY_008233 [Prymnesium sp.]